VVLEHFEEKLHASIQVKGEKSLHLEQYEMRVLDV